RQVVVEEVRQGEPGLEEGALAAAIRGALHGMRPPKGDPDLIARAPRAAVVRFYRDWYRPDLMTVVVSGDIAAAAVASAIRGRFADLVEPDDPRPLPDDDLAIADGTAIFPDPVAGHGNAVVEDLGPDHRRTLADARRVIAQDIRVRARRLAEAT